MLREARDTLVPDLSGPKGPLPPLLLLLTVVTGLVDAFSYLALGRVFVANMTGNVVFLAFSLAGAGAFSVTASVLALVAFALGALAGGWLIRLMPGQPLRLLRAVTAAQALLVAAACVLGAEVALPAAGTARWVLVVLLALTMGGQNAVARRVAVPDLTTTVLTLTVTGIAADSRLVGGPGSRAGVRLLSVLAMFLGALAGAALIVHGHRDVPLLCATLLLMAVAGALLSLRRPAGVRAG
nr:YoaK family protein [Streptomyces acidipaludis]